MKRSTDRILTTHTGSLPRPADLTGMLEALDTGVGPDSAAFDARVRRAVADIVRQQVDAGVDVVSDGEQGKVGYSTYVRHRLTGFDGQSGAAKRADWADFPEAAARAERRAAIMRPACNGPIDWKDRTAVGKDVANLRAAVLSLTGTFAEAAITNFLGPNYLIVTFLDPGKRYVVAIPDYIFKGGDAYAMFPAGEVLITPEAGNLIVTAIAKYLSEKKEISPVVEGRIRVR